MKANKFLTIIFIIFAAFTIFAQTNEQTAQNYIAAKNFTKAREVYAELYRENPSNLVYLNWTARLSAWLGELDKAAQIFDEVLRLEPNNNEALIGKSYVMMWQKKYKKAEILLASAEKNDGDKQAWTIASINFYRYQGKKKQALNLIADAKKSMPGNAELPALEKNANEIENRFSETGCSQSTAPFSTSDSSCYASFGVRRAADEFTFRIEKGSRLRESFTRTGFFWKREIGDKLTVRGGAMFAPKAVISTKFDGAVGFDYALTKHLNFGADYRLLRIQNKNVHIVSPTLLYKFDDKTLASVTVYKGWQNAAERSSSGAVSFQFERRINAKFRAGFGYSRIGESVLFADNFAQNTKTDAFSFKADYRLNKRFTLSANYGIATGADQNPRRAYGFRLSFNR